MTTLNTPTSILASLLARVLDALAILAAKVLPIADAGVFYTAGRSWRLEAWSRRYSLRGVLMTSWTLQVGGFEVMWDLKR